MYWKVSRLIPLLIFSPKASPKMSLLTALGGLQHLARQSLYFMYITAPQSHTQIEEGLMKTPFPGEANSKGRVKLLFPASYTLFLLLNILYPAPIRASVDALCRDETGQISRDPRKNCLKTLRECLTRPSKLTKSHSRASIQLSTCRKASYVAPVLCARIRSHVIS